MRHDTIFVACHTMHKVQFIQTIEVLCATFVVFAQYFRKKHTAGDGLDVECIAWADYSGGRKGPSVYVKKKYRILEMRGRAGRRGPPSWLRAPSKLNPPLVDRQMIVGWWWLMASLLQWFNLFECNQKFGCDIHNLLLVCRNTKRIEQWTMNIPGIVEASPVRYHLLWFEPHWSI